VPALLRWPGMVPPHTEINDIVSAEDWVPTLTAAAGTPDIKEKLAAVATTPAARASRYTSTAMTSATSSPARAPTSAANSSTGPTTATSPALRYDQYKAVFMEQKAHGLEVWMQPLVPLRAPKLFNLRSDPVRAAEQEAGDYDRWFIEHLFILVPAQAIVAQHLQSFQEFPPRQKPGSFSVNEAMEMLMRQKGSN